MVRTGTPYGFGCAGILRVPSEKDRQRLLALAYDMGVRHFDTARMYGLGQAEGVLGRFLQGRRQEVTLTTKFGIEVKPRLAPLIGLQSVGRRVLNAFPNLRSVVRRSSKQMYSAEGFTPENAQASLETSLRELQTDWVDFLLLHDCSAEACRRDDLVDFLKRLVTQGKIRAFGLATGTEVAREVISFQPSLTHVLQVESSALCPVVQSVADKERLIITHGALRDASAAIAHYVQKNPDKAASLSQRLDMDVTDRQAVARLLLCWGVEENREGCLLFSSTSENNIRNNVAWLQEAIEKRRAGTSLPETAAIAAVFRDLQQNLLPARKT